ncbi:hypothetical protein BVRB_9g210230 [Beta vulgaris subsp. vulgaris]|nr:hypothetical protein BVRB_9g210230 [Beta vulgaris subsp. vulgaris]
MKKKEKVRESRGKDLVGFSYVKIRHNGREEESKSHKRTAIITSVTIIGTIVAAILIFFLWRRTMQRGKSERISNRYKLNVGQLELQEPPLYTYDLLRYATDNFDENNKLGEGGFGPVYKIQNSYHTPENLHLPNGRLLQRTKAAPSSAVPPTLIPLQSYRVGDKNSRI